MSERGKSDLHLARNPVLWHAIASANIPAKPPYPSDMQVTPLSVFGDCIWSSPQDHAPISRRDRIDINFSSPAHIAPYPPERLCPHEDQTLFLQLKEVMLGVLFRRNLLRHGTGRVRTLKPTGAYQSFAHHKRMFIAFKICGIRSISEISVETLSRVSQLLGERESGFFNLSFCFQNLLTLSKNGLITDGLRASQFEIVPRVGKIVDTSEAVGWQPFTDEEVARLVGISNAYIDLSPLVARKLRYLKDRNFSEDARSDAVEWAARVLPCGKAIAERGFSTRFIAGRLVELIQCAAGNLISFHSGMRVSELLSSRRGMVYAVADQAALDMSRLELNFVTYKESADPGGIKRVITCHPRLLLACRMLEEIADSIGTPTDYLFVPLGSELPYVTNAWNGKQQNFCEFHNIEVNHTSHRWRKTVAAIAVRVLVGPGLHLKELFGHAILASTARYIMASPFIREEMRDLTLDQYRQRGYTMLESLVALGGDGLGGRFGLELEDRVSRMLSDTDLTESDIAQTLDEFVEEMLRAGILLVPTMPGVFCAKPATARGECAATSGDRLADPGRCSSRCAYQVQEAHRRDLVLWTVRKICASWSRWGALEQRYWAGQCSDQFLAWPDLADELSAEIGNWPALQAAMREASYVIAS